MKLIITILIFLLSISCKQNEEKKIIIEDQIQKTNKVEEVYLKNFSYEDVARYTMASIMSQKPKIITAIKKDKLYHVSYIRKSDRQKFVYKIKFKGNKIMWGNMDGRWRDSQYDEKLSFIEVNNKISIIQVFSDSSEDIQEYKKGE
ncbi:hypothetical protein [Flavobacterium sp. FlaQc-47]|jgi:hypothetical protein|uniref:hypothetical protein n=1 Tax=Flavobacterium sp. FlaQc-47 TaxID=3374180 RepID=UPI003757ABB1